MEGQSFPIRAPQGLADAELAGPVPFPGGAEWLLSLLPSPLELSVVLPLVLGCCWLLRRPAQREADALGAFVPGTQQV